MRHAARTLAPRNCVWKVTHIRWELEGHIMSLFLRVSCLLSAVSLHYLSCLVASAICKLISVILKEVVNNKASSQSPSQISWNLICERFGCGACDSKNHLANAILEFWHHWGDLECHFGFHWIGAIIMSFEGSQDQITKKNRKVSRTNTIFHPFAMPTWEARNCES